MNHTKGPWKVAELAPDYMNARVSGHGGQHVTNVWSGTSPSMDVVEANAYLIASAPDMKEALWSIADHIPENWGDCVEDGWIRLCVTADTIHLIESALDKVGS